MSDHNSAVFNNSCLKIPRNPVSKQPFPVYDRNYIHHLENQARKMSLDSENLKIKSRVIPDVDKRTLKSFIEFYDSIPDYDDVNHLSNKEFYRKLEILKEKQRDYYDFINSHDKIEEKTNDWVEDYKNLNIDGSPKRKPSRKQFCSTPIPCKPTINVIKADYVDSVASSEKDVKPPSRRSVRIESPSEKFTPDISPDLNFFRSKSRANISSAGSKGFNTFNDSVWDELSFDDCGCDQNLTTRSAPSSPSRPKSNVNWKECGITIPKPFEMTVRDEEIKIVDDIMAKTKKPTDEKHDMFRAHPVPIESQIPLFDKIMDNQEKRREKVKRKSKAALKAQMRPFSFTKRDEEMQAISRRLSKSSPCIFLDSPPLKVKPFKAKPIPKHLFSNYIYHKMNEDEFYRALQKKIRAEEMLKAASLPPSMAKREKKKPKYIVCPRSFRDFDIDETKVREAMRPSARTKEDIDCLERELAELEKLENDFIRSSTKGHKSKRKSKGRRNRLCSAESKNTGRSTSALDDLNRSNLAAVLRIQTARKKLELEMCKKLEQAKLREEARWKEKVMRKKPVWQTLQYSHEEDLAMRLQLRRDEERLRNEEHKYRMQSMLGRVKQQPTLFERQSHVKNPKPREELIAKLYKDVRLYSASPKLSISDISDKRSVEMKDEAIQAQFDDMFKDEEEYAMKGDMKKRDSCNCDYDDKN